VSAPISAALSRIFPDDILPPVDYKYPSVKNIREYIESTFEI